MRHVFAQNGDYELICNSNGVRVRAAANLSGAIRGTVNTGDAVWLTGASVEADGYVWIPVTVQGRNLSGWAAAQFFERPDGQTGWIRGTQVHVNSDSVNMRSGAGLSHGIVGNFNTGTNGIINDGPTSANGYQWYNLTIDGVTGWMASDFLDEGFVGWPGPGGGFNIGAYVRPTTDLNLRSGPGTGNAIIDTYGGQNVATVLDGPQSGGGYAWYKVEMWDDGHVGWFAGEFLELARFEPTGARHRVNDGPLNLRESGDLSAPIVTTLATGEIVVIADASFVQADGYTWMMVYIEDDPDVRGWIAQGFSSEI
jgi:uncharacterized protein YgiM (DUF1202 family)